QFDQLVIDIRHPPLYAIARRVPILVAQQCRQADRGKVAGLPQPRRLSALDADCRRLDCRQPQQRLGPAVASVTLAILPKARPLPQLGDDDRRERQKERGCLNITLLAAENLRMEELDLAIAHERFVRPLPSQKNDHALGSRSLIDEIPADLTAAEIRRVLRVERVPEALDELGDVRPDVVDAKAVLARE